MVIPIALTVSSVSLTSCLVQAPVLVAASLFPAPPLCVQITVGFLRHPPSLGLCGLVSGLLSLSLGLVSYLAGFISSAAVAVCPAAAVHPSVWKRISRPHELSTEALITCSDYFLFNKASLFPHLTPALFPDNRFNCAVWIVEMQIKLTFITVIHNV